MALHHRVGGLLLHPSETSAWPSDSDFAEGGESRELEDSLRGTVTLNLAGFSLRSYYVPGVVRCVLGG